MKEKAGGKLVLGKGGLGRRSGSALSRAESERWYETKNGVERQINDLYDCY